MAIVMPASTGALAHGIAYLALAALVADTRWNLGVAHGGAEPSGRRALGAEERDDALTVSRVEAIVADHVDAALVEMRGELAESAKSLTNTTEGLAIRVERLERDVDSLRSRGGVRRRRRAQTTGPLSCDRTTLQARTDAAMDACCPVPIDTNDGHRRFLQADCVLPDTCPTADCATSFVSYFDECGTLLAKFPPAELEQLRGFYTSCQELDANAQLMLDSAEPAMIFHVLVLDEGAAQADSMFAGGEPPPPPPLVQLDPLVPPPPPALPAPPPPPQTGLDAAQEFRRVCTKANLVSCAPVCDEQTYGYLLSIEIDGRGTVMTCNKYDGTFSWQGQASLGGYIGADFDSFFSSVISGAAGTYMATIVEDQRVRTDLTCHPGQVVLVSGIAALPAPPTWGSGGFTVGESAVLSLTYLSLQGQIVVQQGAISLALAQCMLQASVFPTQTVVPDNTTVTIDDDTLLAGARLTAISTRNAETSSIQLIGAAFAGDSVVVFLLPETTFARGEHERYAQMCAAAGLHPVIPETDCTSGTSPVFGPSAFDACTELGLGCLDMGSLFGGCSSQIRTTGHEFDMFEAATGWVDTVVLSPYGPTNAGGGAWRPCCTRQGCSQGTPACTSGSIMNSVGGPKPSSVCCDCGCPSDASCDGWIGRGRAADGFGGCRNNLNNNGWTADPNQGWRDTQFHPVCGLPL
jgi:hypothetical protein